MCYDLQILKKKTEKLNKRYGAIEFPDETEELPKRVSGFGNARLPVLTSENPHNVQFVYWGFVPPFAKNAKDAAIWKNRSLNCRADTLREKLAAKQQSMFKNAISKPCVILADGFYEWHTLTDGTKIPYYISLNDGQTFSIAGLTSTWTDLADPNRVYTGTALCTTAANNLMGFIHNKPKGSEDYRMPAILLPEEIPQWLDTTLKADERLSIINSYPQEEMSAYTVLNFKKKENRTLDIMASLEPFDYGVAGLPTKIQGASFVL